MKFLLQSFLCLLFIILLSCSSLIANDYSIPDIRVEVMISEDGVVHIDEHRTYHFEGSFSWADYSLPKEGFTEIRNIRISEGENQYINSNSEEPGTFSVSESDNEISLKWHYSASDTTLTFTVSYELTDAISVGPDWSEFMWNYLASGRQKSTETFDLEILLPRSTTGDSLYIWGHARAAEFDIETLTDGFAVSGENITRRQTAEIRTLFPTALLNTKTIEITHPELTLDRVLSDESNRLRELEERAEKDAFYAEITPAATIIISLLSIIFFFWIYSRYGRNHSTGTVTKRDTVLIPGQEKPALIGRLLMSRQTTSNHLVATLFDLARRGWFVIREETDEKTGWLSSDKSTFVIEKSEIQPSDETDEYEQMIIDFVEEQITSGNDTFEEIFKGSSSSVMTWYTNWMKKVKSAFDEMGWIDKESYTGVAINIIVQFVLLVASIYFIINGPEIAFIAAIVTILMMAASIGIIRRTPEGEQVYREWKNYHEGLKNADKRTLRMETLDRHFIYATAFHLSKKQLETVLENHDISTGTFLTWMVLTQGSAASPATMASTISTLASSSTTSFAGTTGGSGASVGSAGGGASGGAG